MKIIFYSKDAQFNLTDEEYRKALAVWNNGQKAYIQRLNVSLSPLYIWAGEKPADNDRKKNRDNQWCIKKFGQWYLEDSPETRINLAYYPELEEIKDKKSELPSDFSKKMIENGNF